MKTTGIRTFYIFLLAILAVSGIQLFAQKKQFAASSQSAGRTGRMGIESAELLRQLDADHDGDISEREWAQFFADHDQNDDGRLSPDEIQSSFKQADSEESNPDAGRIAAFHRLDSNKNDGIDAKEWPGKSKDFKYLDANRDGLLSREEFVAHNGRWWNEKFENLDFSGDRVIMRSEWLDSDASFDRLDRDHNGAIERVEFYSR